MVSRAGKKYFSTKNVKNTQKNQLFGRGWLQHFFALLKKLSSRAGKTQFFFARQLCKSICGEHQISRPLVSHSPWLRKVTFRLRGMTARSKNITPSQLKHHFSISWSMPRSPYETPLSGWFSVFFSLAGGSPTGAEVFPSRSPKSLTKSSGGQLWPRTEIDKARNTEDHLHKQA